MSPCRPCGVAILCRFLWLQLWVASHPSQSIQLAPLGCLLEALKPQALMPYILNSCPHSAGVLLPPILQELSNYCECTGKWKEFSSNHPCHHYCCQQDLSDPQGVSFQFQTFASCCSLWHGSSDRVDHTSSSLLLLNLQSLQLKNYGSFIQHVTTVILTEVR